MSNKIITRVKATVVTIFPPRNNEEAEYLGYFESPNGVEYARYTTTSVSGSDIENKPQRTYGQTLMFGKLAEKATELLTTDIIRWKKEAEEYKAAIAKNPKTKLEEPKKPHITLRIDGEQHIEPWTKGQASGLNCEWRPYGFEHGGYYYTTKKDDNGVQHLVVKPIKADGATTDTTASNKTKKVNFFDL